MHSPLSKALLASSLFLLPFGAFAHEHRTYQIGEKQYNITAGSMNEPIHVDDKSGVEVMISDISTPKKDTTTDDDGPVGIPVNGLEQTLKVEISAGDQKKILDLRPVWGSPGSYSAVFYPTMQTTYTYRLFGTINAVDVDLSFVCNPASTEAAPTDTTAKKMSDTVTQLTKGGAFSCPEAREDIEFPSRTNGKSVQHSGPSSTVAIALAAVAIAMSSIALRRKG